MDKKILYGLGILGIFGLIFLKRQKPFTIVALPDTQQYCDNYPAVFTNQTQWIIDNKDRLNIKFVVHLGDIVEHGDRSEEWNNANASLSILDNKVPYLLSPGNHDYNGECNINIKNSLNYNSYFPSTRYENYDWYGGNYPEGTNDNNYGLFSEGRNKFLIIGLEFCPSDEILSWADSVIGLYPDRKVIIFTHCYLNSFGDLVKKGDAWSCSSYNCCSDCEECDCNEGDEMWNDFIKNHKNIILVLSGHMGYSGSATTSLKVDNINDSLVYQTFQNWQYDPNGGNGWLRYYTFRPSERKIDVKTYSTYLDIHDNEQEFELDY